MPDKKRMSMACEMAMKWCVLAVIFAAPFSKSISEVAIVIAGLALIANKMLKREAYLAATDLNLALAVFVLSMLPSFINSHYLAISLKAVFSKSLKYVLLYFVIVEGIDTRSKLKDLFLIGLLSALVITTDGLVQHYFTGIDFLHFYPSFKSRLSSHILGFFRGFPTASFPYPNDLAAWIVLVVFPIGCAAIFDLKRSRMRYAAYAAAAALFYLLFLTKARAAWTGFTASTVYLALAKKNIWLILLLVAVISVPFLLKMEVAEHILGMTSISDRLDMWKVGWRVFKDHPVIGNGLNTFFMRYMEYRTDIYRGQKGAYAHNCYLQMASDVGVIGLAGFLALVAAYFVSVARNMRRVRDRLDSNVLLGLSVGVFAFLVLAFFDTNLYSLNLVTLFWCAIGVSQAIIRVASKEAS
jgi:O-antigen ligase